METIQNNVYAEPKRLSKRNLVTFSMGTIGRDAACAGLFMGNILNYIYFTKRLTGQQFAVLTFIMAAAKIFDALNDPIMGNIVDATHSRWGKFKPWITIGMVGTAIVVLASFSNTLQGWPYVIFFGCMYFAFSIVFTMNDISYWGMIPSLARQSDDRNRLTAMTALCANIGGGVCGMLLPVLTTGDLAIKGSAVSAYRMTSGIFVLLFIVFQIEMLIGVQEDKSQPQTTDKVSLRNIIDIFKANDQLRWIALAYLCIQLVPTAAITMYIYFQFGYNGTLLTLFYTFSGIATMAVNVFYPKLSKKLNRDGLMKLAWIFEIVGNLGMLLLAIALPNNDKVSFTIPFFNATVTLKYFLIDLIYFFCGFGGTCFYMILMVCIANTTEYNDYKFGKRCEGVVFSTRPFLTKLGSAINTLVAMLFYIVIGINTQTNKIASLEQAANRKEISNANKLTQIADILHSVSNNKVISLIALVCIVSIVVYTAAYLIYKKKYIISEEYFNDITEKIRIRNVLQSQGEDISAEDVELTPEFYDRIKQPAVADDTILQGIAEE